MNSFNCEVNFMPWERCGLWQYCPFGGWHHLSVQLGVSVFRYSNGLLTPLGLLLIPIRLEDASLFNGNAWIMYMFKCVLQQLRKEFGRRHVKVTMETDIVHIVISPHQPTLTTEWMSTIQTTTSEICTIKGQQRTLPANDVIIWTGHSQHDLSRPW